MASAFGRAGRLIVSAFELYSYTIRGGVYGFLAPICDGWGKAPAEELLLEAGRGLVRGALDGLLGGKEAQDQGEWVVTEEGEEEGIAMMEEGEGKEEGVSEGQDTDFVGGEEGEMEEGFGEEEGLPQEEQREEDAVQSSREEESAGTPGADSAEGAGPQVRMHLQQCLASVKSSLQQLK